MNQAAKGGNKKHWIPDRVGNDKPYPSILSFPRKRESKPYFEIHTHGLLTEPNIDFCKTYSDATKRVPPLPK